MYTEVDGDLFDLAKKGQFDVIAHGCNCFNTMGAGIAVDMAKIFGCNTYPTEMNSERGDIEKLGSIEWNNFELDKNNNWIESPDEDYQLTVVNAYTQYDYKFGTLRLNYNALLLCFQKMNHIFKGKRIGLPKIGAGLAGGNWTTIRRMIQSEFKDCDVTVVNYKL